MRCKVNYGSATWNASAGGEQCSCGVFHVTVGPMTLRLEHSAAEALWLMVKDGVSQAAREQRPPRLRLVRGEASVGEG